MGNPNHKDALDRTEGATDSAFAPLRSPQRSLSILLIEDNLGIATGMRIMLERLGHSVHTAHTGPQGLRLAQLLLPDVVVSDIGLPDMNGYDVARRLSSDAATCGIKLVAMTGYGFTSFARQAREAGFDCFLAKPVSVEAIRDALISVEQDDDSMELPARDFCLSLRH